MVFVFFCVSGVVGPMSRHPSLTTREYAPEATRPLDRDVQLLGKALSPYPGAVIVVGNDWPLYYDLKNLREVGHGFGCRVVNVINTIGSTKERAVFDFMENREEPFVILASRDFEFTHRTALSRINVEPERGFDENACVALELHLNGFGAYARDPLSDDEILRATVGIHALRKARDFKSPLRANEDVAFQRHLAEMLFDVKREES
ncbi:hypothetical protein R70006_03807 [Paraburkholderia domus]|uniref:hypothetical protein n=1 Tax=Paraburkholderia domus TaxID=2793075 RepID=UPI00191144D7|nr:hypothetical protein [Paraburkholderia domus]MBK5047270.1 hypothetical protein [Burkholderia sp. R-70006]CAE6767933.1 hypothetical protein R70006_03807 [Paraburkholderia domus]